MYESFDHLTLKIWLGIQAEEGLATVEVKSLQIELLEMDMWDLKGRFHRSGAFIEIAPRRQYAVPGTIDDYRLNVGKRRFMKYIDF